MISPINQPSLFLLAIFFIAGNSACCNSCNDNLRDELECLGVIKSPPEECKPIPPSILSNTPYKTISSINKPYGIYVDGDNVYVAGFGDGYVHKFDQDGNFIKKYSAPGNPIFIEVHESSLYVTNHIDTVYIKPRCNDDPFVKFLTMNKPPISFRFTPDGEYFLVGEHRQSAVRVYQKNRILDSRITNIPSSDERVIHWDRDGNMQISSYRTYISVYTKGDYKFVKKIPFPGSKYLEGWIYQCDGGRILADRSGKVLFADKNDKVVKVVAGFGEAAHVGVTKDRKLFVSDFKRSKVYIYK